MPLVREGDLALAAAEALQHRGTDPSQVCSGHWADDGTGPAYRDLTDGLSATRRGEEVKYQDNEYGEAVCTRCGAQMPQAATKEHDLVHEQLDTEKAPLAEEGARSALSGVPPPSVQEQPTTPVSTFLPIGAFRTSDHQYYFNGQGPVPGATGVLEVLSKPALINWKSREAARAGIRFGAIHAHDGFDWDDGINQAVKEADEQRDTAAKLGSSIHLLADMASRAPESDSKAFHVSKEEIPYLDAWKGFCAFLQAQGGTIVSSEHMVWSLNGYGGTYDLIVEWDGQLWLLDIKTSKGYYPEYGLQLAAYRWADSIILERNPTPYQMPEIHRTGIVHLRPDQYPDTGWRLVEYPITYEKDYMAFLGALEVYRWRKEERFRKSVLSTVTEANKA